MKLILFFLFIIIVIFIITIIRYCIMLIMLGYCPATYAFKNIEGEIRIYHNGISESQCIDEHEYCMNYYYVPPKWIAWLYFNVDSFLDHWQQKAYRCRNLLDLRNDM